MFAFGWWGSPLSVLGGAAATVALAALFGMGYLANALLPRADAIVQVQSAPKPTKSLQLGR